MRSPVLILEDLPDTQAWLSAIVREVLPDAAVTLAATLRQARAVLRAQPWHFMLVDLGLPDGSGIELLHEARRAVPAIPAIVTTIYDDDDNLFNALAAGAAGYLLKSQSRQVLARQLQLQRQGQPPISPAIARRLMQHFQGAARALAQDAPFEPLTEREQQVLALLAQGLRTREAAAHLGLAESTVTTYIRAIYEKLGVSNRAEAARVAQRMGIAAG